MFFELSLRWAVIYPWDVIIELSEQSINYSPMVSKMNNVFFSHWLPRDTQGILTLLAKKSPVNSNDGRCWLFTAMGLRKLVSYITLLVKHFDILEQKVLFKYKEHFLLNCSSMWGNDLSSNRAEYRRTVTMQDWFLLKRP